MYSLFNQILFHTFLYWISCFFFFFSSFKWIRFRNITSRFKAVWFYPGNECDEHSFFYELKSPC